MTASHQQRRTAALAFKQACGEQAGATRRLSLMHPQFNLREVAKQMLLLEDHLCHPYKHCPDCIRKHLLTIEAFSEEAVSLDRIGIYRDLAEALAETAREWLEDVADKRPLAEIAQEIRTIRKRLVQMVADPREAITRVAARHLALSSPCTHQRSATRG